MQQDSGYSWSPIGGQAGSAASVVLSLGITTVSGLTGITNASVLHFLTVSGCATPGNNGTFQIIAVVSATEVIVDNPSSATDANNGSIAWSENTNTTTAPATVGVPSDNDAWDASEFAPGFLGLAQRTANLLYNLPAQQVFEYTGSGTLPVPVGAAFMAVMAWGGGGGGEGGCRGADTSGGASSEGFANGAGGAGAPMVTGVIAVTPGHLLTVTVGAAGTAGAGGGGAGGDGGDSSVADGATTLIRARGGRGAGIGTENYASGLNRGANPTAGVPSYTCCSPGAVGIASSNPRPPPYAFDVVGASVSSGGAFIDLMSLEREVPSRGGSAVKTMIGHPANASAGGSSTPGDAGYVGGAGGLDGTGSGTIFPGCGGGGGGAGPGGNGGAGGTGGNAAGSSATAPNAGATGGATAGTAPPANSGGGGGGGGCGGDGGTGGGTGAAGSAGGSGYLLIAFLQAQQFVGSITTP